MPQTTAQCFNLAEGDDIWIIPFEATHETLERFLKDPWDFVERWPGMEANKETLFPKDVPITIQFLYNLPLDKAENPTFIAQGVHTTNHITVQCPRFRALPPEAKLSADEAERYVSLRGGTDVILKTLDGTVPVAYTHFEPSTERKSVAANSARLARDPQLLAPFLNALRDGRSGHPVKDHRLTVKDGVYVAAESAGSEEPYGDGDSKQAVQYRMPDPSSGETFHFTYQTMMRRGSLEADAIICYKVAGTYNVVNSTNGSTTVVTLNHATQFLWGGTLWLDDPMQGPV